MLSCIVKNANSTPQVYLEHFVEPSLDRTTLASEGMPIQLLNKEELNLLTQLPHEILKPLISDNHFDEIFMELGKPKPNLTKIETKMPYLSEAARIILPLRDTDKITEAKLPYQRK